MPLIVAFLILSSLVIAVICAITALFFAIKKKPHWKHYLAGTFLGFILFFLLVVTFPTPPTTEPQTTIQANTPETEQTTPAIAIKEFTKLSILGAPVENFKNKFGELNTKKTNIEFHRYAFLNPSLSISGNYGNPETVQSINLDLRTYDNNTHKLMIPETFPIQSITEIDNILKNYLPEDAILEKEKTFKDSSLQLPVLRHKTLRLYKSKWLVKNLVPFASLPDYDRSDFLPDGLFTVIIEKLDRGYLELIIIFGSSEWELDSSWKEL